MIILKTDENMFNDLGDVLRLFFGQVAVAREAGDSDSADMVVVHTQLETEEEWIDRFQIQSAEGERVFQKEHKIVRGDPLTVKRFRKRYAKHTLFLLLQSISEVRPPWGSLTGIRPTRLLYENLNAGMDIPGAVEKIQNDYGVRKDKAELLGWIVEEQRPFMHPSPEEFDVYIGIPFCTTRCSYCAFASLDLKHGRKWMEAYIDALEKEISGMQAALAPYRLRSLYIGGGTPTALPDPLFGKLMEIVGKYFPNSREFTVEAGRPDTITKEKLSLIKQAGADRISVNPQTMNDITLQKIGRSHTAEDILEAMRLVRETGFRSVNMDLILALPDETLEMLDETLEKVCSLRPENLTVHTLAIKRSSKLHLESVLNADAFAGRQQSSLVEKMIEQAIKAALDSGYRPYYLYRQKMMAGNMENIGWCQKDKACIYNIDNMEEIVPVMAFGAGAISKWMFDRTRRIERAPNLRNVEEYIHRVDEMVTRKLRLLEVEISQQHLDQYLSH